MSTEIELKLEVEPDDLPLVRQDSLLANTESCNRHQVTVYYDTPETNLKNGGFTLRVRSSNGRYVQTVKPITDAVGLMSREEVETDVSSLSPDLTSLEQHPIHALIKDGDVSSLRPLIRSDVNRTTWQIDRGNGKFQVDLDHGTIMAGARCTSFAEIEFELQDGPPASLIMAARNLSDRAPVRIGVLTKAERGFRLADDVLGKVHKAGPVMVTPEMSVAHAFETIVHACLKHYRLNEPLVLHETKAAALHQTRVAMRRLRSALTLFRPAIEDVEFQHLRNELRWFTAQLGDARNLDVYLERDLPSEERRHLNVKRERIYEQVADAMNSHKFRRLFIDLIGWTAIGAWRTGKIARRPVGSFANGRLDRLWRSITEAGRDLGAMDDGARHRLRIQAKKLRYAIEFLEGLYADSRPAEKHFARAVAELQESLGKLNDMVTAKAMGEELPKHSWLIGSPAERRHLAAADEALRDLRNIGPFWRAEG